MPWVGRGIMTTRVLILAVNAGHIVQWVDGKLRTRNDFCYRASWPSLVPSFPYFVVPIECIRY